MSIGEIALPDNGDDGDGDRGDDGDEEKYGMQLGVCNWLDISSASWIPTYMNICLCICIFVYVFVYLHFCICICVIFSADDRADTSSSPGLPTYESSHATSPDCPSMSLPAGW